jgi:peroxiredoxin
MDKINNTGARLVAISPMLQDKTAEFVEKLGITFPVLCDKGNEVAHKFGLVFTLEESVQPIYRDLGIDLVDANGYSSQQLPLPATYILKRDGTIAFNFVDVDHTNRLDPEVMLDTLDTLE